MIKIDVKGKPLSKSNNLSFGRGKAYIPKKHKDYQDKVRQAAIWAMDEHEPITGPVRAEIHLRFPDKRRRDAGNYQKTILDALNGICYDDDCQIVHLTITKTVEKNNPGAEIWIGPYEFEPYSHT